MPTKELVFSNSWAMIASLIQPAATDRLETHHRWGLLQCL